MSTSDVYRCWEWPLTADPAAIWPLISNTDRFNQDSGIGSVEQLEGRRSLRLTRLGVTVEWDEEPFEWVRPERFGVVRRYRRGPLAEMRVLAEILQTPARMLRYQVWAKPRNLIGKAMVAAQLVESGMRFGQTVKQYDGIAARGSVAELPERGASLASGGAERLQKSCRELLSAACDPELVGRLCEYIEHAADRDAHRIRPYALADAWGAARRPVLELFLRAARAGLLEFQWDLLCPSCRGAKQSAAGLADMDSRVHCDACQIDFTADFTQSVELTFRPHPSVREVHVAEYCVGGPQNTPHVVLQQILEPGGERTVCIPLEPGAYRYRQWGRSGWGQRLEVREGGAGAVLLDGSGAATLSTRPSITLRNKLNETAVMVIERAQWSDQAATAAQVTAMPLFRELFADETLRPGEPVPAGVMTVMFTNVRGSTDRCRELGDLAALRSLMRHLQILTECVQKEGGTLIKTMGDRTMSVFPRPESAVRAAVRARRTVSGGVDAMQLGVGIHCGPLIAVTLHDRMDYFGAAANLAGQMAGEAQGQLLVSADVAEDARESGYRVEPDGERFRVVGDS